jgi:hypothetical protein
MKAVNSIDKGATKMTRKDYILIAETLRVTYLEADRNSRLAERAFGEVRFADGVTKAAEKVADSLARDNVRFDRNYFLAVVRGEKALNSRPGRVVNVNNREVR